MRDQHVDITRAEPVGLQALHDHLTEAHDGVLEDELTVHVRVIGLVVGIVRLDDIGHPARAHARGEQR